MRLKHITPQFSIGHRGTNFKKMSTSECRVHVHFTVHKNHEEFQSKAEDMIKIIKVINNFEIFTITKCEYLLSIKFPLKETFNFFYFWGDFKRKKFLLNRNDFFLIWKFILIYACFIYTEEDQGMQMQIENVRNLITWYCIFLSWRWHLKWGK